MKVFRGTLVVAEADEPAGYLRVESTERRVDAPRERGGVEGLGAFQRSTRGFCVFHRAHRADLARVRAENDAFPSERFCTIGILRAEFAGVLQQRRERSAARGLIRCLVFRDGPFVLDSG